MRYHPEFKLVRWGRTLLDHRLSIGIQPSQNNSLGVDPQRLVVKRFEAVNNCPKQQEAEQEHVLPIGSVSKNVFDYLSIENNTFIYFKGESMSFSSETLVTQI